jgi:hypothetical protein
LERLLTLPGHAEHGDAAYPGVPWDRPVSTAEPVKVFVVAATSGEYSDRTEWDVCCYYDREQAELHVAALTAAVKALPWGVPWDEQDTHPAYVVVEIDLWAHFDQFQGLD